MKCPECVEVGKRSVVRKGLLTTTTLGGNFEHWDEDGKPHVHDPNTLRNRYSCSRGHEWAVRKKKPCPTCGDEW